MGIISIQNRLNQRMLSPSFSSGGSMSAETSAAPHFRLRFVPVLTTVLLGLGLPYVAEELVDLARHYSRLVPGIADQLGSPLCPARHADGAGADRHRGHEMAGAGRLRPALAQGQDLCRPRDPVGLVLRRADDAGRLFAGTHRAHRAEARLSARHFARAGLARLRRHLCRPDGRNPFPLPARHVPRRDDAGQADARPLRA